METTATYQPFNETQLHLLRMFAFTKTEQTLQEWNIKLGWTRKLSYAFTEHGVAMFEKIKIR